MKKRMNRKTETSEKAKEMNKAISLLTLFSYFYTGGEYAKVNRLALR
jgi:hypothetical protein